MPNAYYYWQGGPTSAGISRFDFNSPSNWRIARWGTSQANWAVSATAPGRDDFVYFGRGFGGQGFTAQSPCLYGGYSGSVALGEWRNGIAGNTLGGTGTTQSSSLRSATVYMHNAGYPFAYFGGGITGEIYNYCVNVLGLDASEITGATAEHVNRGLTLKVSGTLLIHTTGRISDSFEIGGIDFDSVPNYSVVNLNTVQSRNTNIGLTAATLTSLLLNSNIGTGPNASDRGLGNVTINGGGFRSITIESGLSGFNLATARPYRVNLNGITAQTVTTLNSDINIDRNSTIGSFVVPAGPNPYYLSRRQSGFDGREITLSCTINGTQVENALGFLPSVTGQAFSSGVYLYDQYTTSPGNDNYDYSPTILVGLPDAGATFTAPNFAVFNEIGPFSSSSGNSQRPWIIEFFGDSTIDNMYVEGTTIRAMENVNGDSTFTIRNLAMAENSVLDLRYAPQADNWIFGAISGSGASATIEGGINFEDSTCTVRGDTGIRLYNTNMVGNYDNRSKSTSSLSFEKPSGGKGEK